MPRYVKNEKGYEKSFKADWAAVKKGLKKARSKIDYVSIDFKEGVEAKSYFENGVIVRLDGKGNVIGLGITDSSQFFSGDDEVDLKEACALLGVSESTLRRRIREGTIKFRRPNGKHYRFRRKDILKRA